MDSQPFDIVEELRSLGIPLPPPLSDYTRATSNPPEMKTSMDTDPIERVKRRRTFNADQERLITLDESFTELPDHGRANDNAHIASHHKRSNEKQTRGYECASCAKSSAANTLAVHYSIHARPRAKPYTTRDLKSLLELG